MNKVTLLARYLDLREEDIQVSDERITPYTEYRTPDGTYWVMDEEESRQAVYEDIENLIDDLGIYDLFMHDFINWIENNAIDQEWFEAWWFDDFKDYAWDIEGEEDNEYGNRLNRECLENKVVREDEIVNGKYIGKEYLYEAFANKKINDIKEGNTTFSEELVWQYGKDELKYILKDNPNVIDMDAVVDECIRLDGYGHNLSSWDGKTIELEDDMYAYKQSDYDEREL